MAAPVPPLREALKRRVPTLEVERALWVAGAGVVVGMDEVGRGAWAGPLTVGAAVLPSDRRVYKVRDSKMLTEDEREALFGRVAGWCRLAEARIYYLCKCRNQTESHNSMIIFLI